MKTFVKFNKTICIKITTRLMTCYPGIFFANFEQSPNTTISGGDFWQV